MTSMEKAPKKRRRLLWWPVSLVLVYALVGMLIVPAVAHRQILPLLQQRVSEQASVGEISFNPFALSVEIRDLVIRDARSELALAFDSLYGDVALLPLLRGEILLQDLRLDGFYLGVHRYSETESNIAQLIARWNATATPSSEAPPAQQAGALPQVEIVSLQVTGASFGISDDVPAVPFRVHLEAMDFALQNLSTVPEHAAAQQSFTLALGDGSQLRWQGDLAITPLSSKGELQVFGPLTDLAYRYFQADIPVALKGGWFDAGLTYEVSLDAAGELAARLENIHASLRELQIFSLQDAALLARLPNIELTGGELDLGQRLLQFDRLDLDDFEILAERFSNGEINFLRILPPAQTTAAPVVAELASVPNDAAQWRVTITEAALERWRVRLQDALPQEPVDIALALNARATNISNQAGARINVDTDMVLSSGGSLRAGGALTALPEFRYDGELTLMSLLLPVVQPYLEEFANIRLESGELGVEGSLQVSSAQTSFSGGLRLQDLAITDTIQDEALLGIGALQIAAVDLLLGDALELGIGTVRLQQPYARIEIEADGTTNLSRLLKAPAASVEQEQSQAQAQETAAIPALRLDQLLIEDASADFSDSSLPLPFAVHMTHLGGEVSALSSRSSEPARVSLEGQVDEFGLASISGRLRPLDYSALTEIDLMFRNLDIPSLSPYVIKFAGRRIAGGDLDVDLSYKITQRQLSGANSMVMRDLELGERLPHPDALDLPLGLAIALLKDRKGVIDLDVPVSGDLDNPQFSYGSVIRRALANIIRNIATSPFRFLANLVGGAAETDFGMLSFVPGRADLLPPEREKLVKLGSALLERPQLQLGLSGAYQLASDTAALQSSRFDARVQAALETLRQTAAPELTASAMRLQVLEQFYRESGQLSAAADGGAPDAAALVAAEEFLKAQREQFTSPVAGAQQFDDLAYSESLRRLLIPQEIIVQDDLDALARQRGEAVVQALSEFDASVGERVQLAATLSAVALQDERVPLELSLSALGR